MNGVARGASGTRVRSNHVHDITNTNQKRPPSNLTLGPNNRVKANTTHTHIHTCTYTRTEQPRKGLLDDAPLPADAVVERHLLRVRDEALRDEAVLPLADLDEGLDFGGRLGFGPGPCV